MTIWIELAAPVVDRGIGRQRPSRALPKAPAVGSRGTHVPDHWGRG
jgi:hypothetical protein